MRQTEGQESFWLRGRQEESTIRNRTGNDRQECASWALSFVGAGQRSRQLPGMLLVGVLLTGVILVVGVEAVGISAERL